MPIEAMHGLIEMGFFDSIAIGIGIWQLVKTRRELTRDRATKVEDTEDVEEERRAVRSISSGKSVKTD